ncbi:glycoside hydrolase family 3 C-terminal domain-containing protein [Brachybacterium hainanense]|uniref:Glycoside hydrolase family 3 C-terminal domain-containing protein n=1 Tax=Brachybacterium hainanense TaxID=1541174 RepID=A0ABV6R6K3_9MICO
MASSDLHSARTARISAADARRLRWARRIVAAMTPAERIAQLHQHSPGVERLGIGPFVTGTEGVHGVAWKGEATQLPQPVGMAASWDPALLRRAAALVALEVREMHAADPRVSLSVWAPVVNPLRHPLWGRTEEAYTEDPLLNSALACGFSAGLRGGGETWRTLPTLKHFLAYSHETDRAATSSQMPHRVLHEYELPGFVEPVARGLAASVMLSYNLVDGRPAHLTDLLETQLRAQLPDPDLLFVVSDAGAPSNLFRSQKTVGTPASAYAAMLRAGVDSFTDHDTDPRETIAALGDALEAGLVDIGHVDRALVRQLVARARTGEFDALLRAEDRQARCEDAPADEQEGILPDERADERGHDDGPCPTRAERRALSREVAVRSAVLLARREGSAALPLPPGPLAVLGEQSSSVLRDWYSGEFPETTSIAEALARRRTDEVRVRRGIDRIRLRALTTGLCAGAGDAALAPEDGEIRLATDGSLRAPRPAADGPALAATAAQLEVLDLGEDVLALRERSTSLLLAPDDRGQIMAAADRIGGWIVQETLRRRRCEDGSWLLQHTGSGRYLGLERHTGALVLRSADPASGARFSAEVLVSGAEEAAEAVAAGTAQEARTVVLVIGNDPHVHGRETEDRPHARLPGPARAAVEQLAALPDRIARILVITSSYPYDLEGLEERVDAVVWSSHAGEAEGEAIADLLQGERDFSGRLAQTWPDSSPLPDLLDYDVIGAGATYLYGQSARFPFGHGLSVDRADWSDASVTTGEDGLEVCVRVRGPLARTTAGALREVVQVYADVPASSFPRRRYDVPATRLVGFDVVEVPAGDGVEAHIAVPYSRLALWSTDRGSWELPEGPVTVRLSRSSAAEDTVARVRVTIPAAGTVGPAGTDPASPLVVPADRAERTWGAARCATTPLEGTELRALGSASGTALFTLEAGTEVLELMTRALEGGATDRMPASASTEPAVLVAEDGTMLPLPHRVPADDGRPTGQVLVRIGPGIALLGLRCARP